MNDSSKTIDKLKKLLAMAQSPNIHEADTALQMAQRIALKNDIDLSKIKMQGRASHMPMVKNTYSGGKSRLPVTHDYVAWILEGFFEVKIIMAGNRCNGREVHFIGTEEKVEFAIYLYNYLNMIFMKLWHDEKNRSALPATARQSYLVGLYNGLRTKLMVNKDTVERECLKTSLEVHNYGLMVVNNKEELQKATATFFPRLVQIQKIYHQKNVNDVRDKGFAAGQNIEIHSGLSGLNNPNSSKYNLQ